MSIEWETVTSLPKRSSGRPRLTLEPGQMVRRPVGNKGQASSYNKRFKSAGRTDYHAYLRIVDGVSYLYIVRDEA